MPVFVEQPLENFSSSPEDYAGLPLGPPSYSVLTQGLHLFTNGDILIGRADNRMNPSSIWKLDRRLHSPVIAMSR